MVCCGGSCSDLKSKKFYVALFAELMGTALLTMVGCGSVEGIGRSYLHISIAFGLSVASIVWSIAHVSGGHINPAVTIAFLVTRKISLARAILYMVVQTIGAIIGAGLLRGLTPESSNTINESLGMVSLGGGITAGQGFGVEFLITFIFIFVIFSAVDSGRRDVGGSVPLTIGFTIVMCHLWAIPFTGSGMNPARALGPAVVTSQFDNQWIYWVGPLLGGIVGGILYDFVFATNASFTKFKGFFSLNYDNDNYDSNGLRAQSSNGLELKA